MQRHARVVALKITLILILLFTSVSCATRMSGSPSLTLLSRGKAVEKSVNPIGSPVKESACSYWVLVFFFFGSEGRSHETLVQRALTRANADLLINAQLEESGMGIPYLFMPLCSTVKGQPAVFNKEVKQ